MKLLIGLAFAAVTAAYSQKTSQQAPQMDSCHTVPRMCGVLERSWEIPKKHSTQIEKKKGPLRSVRLELYGQQGTTLCCEQLVLSAQAKTDEDGRYAFKKIAPGAYWLAFQVDGRRYSYPLLYQPVKHADPDCNSFYLNFDKTAKIPLTRELYVE